MAQTACLITRRASTSSIFTGVAGVHAFNDLALTQINSKTVLIDFDGIPGGDTLTVQKTTIAILTAHTGDFLFS